MSLRARRGRGCTLVDTTGVKPGCQSLDSLSALFSYSSRTTASPSAQSLRRSRAVWPHSGSQDRDQGNLGQASQGGTNVLFSSQKLREAPRSPNHWTSASALITVRGLDKTVPPHSYALWSQDSEVQVFGSVTIHLPLHNLESIKQRKPRFVTCPCLGPAG